MQLSRSGFEQMNQGINGNNLKVHLQAEIFNNLLEFHVSIDVKSK
ncbi:MAG: hypothetical protein ACTSWN_04950 [Promethearchaeota archaeon]